MCARARSVSPSYQKKADAGDQAAHQVLIAEIRGRVPPPDDIPEIGEGLEQGLHGQLVVGLAVVGGQPAAGGRVEQRAIGPAVGVDGVNEDDVALFQRQSDGVWGDVVRGVEGIEGAQIVVEDVWRGLHRRGRRSDLRGVREIRSG